MNALEAYRDDGPLFGWAAAHRSRRSPPPVPGLLAWLVPPLVRATEYGLVIALTALTDRDALPLAFAFLAVLAFHHYDIVYRLRDQGRPPPRWVSTVGGGWDGRIVAVAVLAAVDALGPALLVAACVLGPVFVGESVASWVRARPRPVAGGRALGLDDGE